MPSSLAWGASRAIVEAARLGVPLAWPNEVLDPAPEGLFVRCGMRAGDSFQAELGGAETVWEETGAAEFHILAPAGTGSAGAREIANRIASAFRAANLPGAAVAWTGWSLTEGEPAEGGAWWALHLEIEYRLQTIPAP